MNNMPMRPTLMRVSKPGPVEKLRENLIDLAHQMTARELGELLGVSPGTVTQRRHGRGWTVGSICKVAAFLDINPSSVFADLGTSI